MDPEDTLTPEQEEAQLALEAQAYQNQMDKARKDLKEILSKFLDACPQAQRVMVCTYDEGDEYHVRMGISLLVEFQNGAVYEAEEQIEGDEDLPEDVLDACSDLEDLIRYGRTDLHYCLSMDCSLEMSREDREIKEVRA